MNASVDAASSDVTGGVCQDELTGLGVRVPDPAVAETVESTLEPTGNRALPYGTVNCSAASPTSYAAASTDSTSGKGALLGTGPP